jgi:hypothetical protein
VHEGPLHLLLAAPPAAAGAAALLARLGPGGPRVLLVARGLAWAEEGRLGELGASTVAVCSQDARGAGWTLEAAPAGVRWTSVGTWLAEMPGDAPLWVALP